MSDDRTDTEQQGDALVRMISAAAHDYMPVIGEAAVHAAGSILFSYHLPSEVEVGKEEYKRFANAVYTRDEAALFVAASALIEWKAGEEQEERPLYFDLAVLFSAAAIVHAATAVSSEPT